MVAGNGNTEGEKEETPTIQPVSVRIGPVPMPEDRFDSGEKRSDGLDAGRSEHVGRK